MRQPMRQPGITIVSFEALFYSFVGFTKVRFHKLQKYCFKLMNKEFAKHAQFLCIVLMS